MNNISTDDAPQGFLAASQAAELCCVTRNAVFKWVQSGYLDVCRTFHASSISGTSQSASPRLRIIKPE
jgi:hypothetical protein